MEGQMDIFDFIDTPEEGLPTPSYKHPCDSCDIAFGSKVCFLRRGYFWDNYNHSFLRDHFGKLMRSSKGKECDYEPRDLNLQCFESWKVGINGIKFGECPYFPAYDGINHCTECREYSWFWTQIKELEEEGYKLTEAIAIIDERWGIRSAYEYDVRSYEEVKNEQRADEV